MSTVALGLSVQNLNNGQWFGLPHVFVVDEISVMPNALLDRNVLKEHPYLRGVKIPVVEIQSV